MSSEALIVQEQAKCFSPQFAVADMRVPIYPRPETLLRIIEMEDAQTAQADGVVECLHRCRVDLLIADVVARGKDMTGVEADPDAGLILHQRQDHGQLIE